MIISGGETMYPAEVEDVLFSHPDVTEAAVVGEEDEEWGERVVAFIVGNTTVDELEQYMRDSDDLANFKRLRKYHFIDNIPKTLAVKFRIQASRVKYR